MTAPLPVSILSLVVRDALGIGGAQPNVSPSSTFLDVFAPLAICGDDPLPISPATTSPKTVVLGDLPAEDGGKDPAREKADDEAAVVPATGMVPAVWVSQPVVASVALEPDPPSFHQPLRCAPSACETPQEDSQYAIQAVTERRPTPKAATAPVAFSVRVSDSVQVARAFPVSGDLRAAREITSAPLSPDGIHEENRSGAFAKVHVADSAIEPPRTIADSAIEPPKTGVIDAAPAVEVAAATHGGTPITERGPEFSNRRHSARPTAVNASSAETTTLEQAQEQGRPESSHNGKLSESPSKRQLSEPGKGPEQRRANLPKESKAAAPAGRAVTPMHAIDNVALVGDRRERSSERGPVPGAVEPAFSQKERMQPAAAREFVLRLPAGLENRVEVRLIECAGKVRVTVRCSDEQLTGELRNQLGELVRTITDKGLKIEAWTPPDSLPSSLATARADFREFDGAFAGSDAGGSRDDGRQQHQQEHREQHRRGHEWLEALHAGLEEEE